MEPQFKSSFIPKKPVAPVAMRQVRSKPLGLLFTLGSVVLVASLISAAGLFGYTKYLEADIEKKSAALEQARRELQPALIEEIRRVDARMRHAKDLLRNHLALSPVFTLLEESTLLSIQFTNFAYTFSPEGMATLTLKGVAPNFTSLALQSDVVYRNPTFTRASFSSVSLDEFGNVQFDLELEVDPATVAYRNVVEAARVDIEESTSTEVPIEGEIQGNASSTQL